MSSIKVKTKKTLLKLILILMIVVGTLLLAFNNVKALTNIKTEGEYYIEYENEEGREVFSGYESNWNALPTRLFADEGISLWCINRKRSNS